MHIIQTPLFDFEAFIAKKGNDRLVMALEALPAEGLLSALEKARWTGRKGYSVRGMWSALIAGVLRQAHSLADVVRLLERDKDTRLVCGFSEEKEPPPLSQGSLCLRSAQNHQEQRRTVIFLAK